MAENEILKRVSDAVLEYRKINAELKLVKARLAKAKLEAQSALQDSGEEEFTDDTGYAKFITTPASISVSDAKGLYAQAEVWSQSENPDVATLGESVLLRLKVRPPQSNQFRLQ
jgi:hypothetical protein